MNLLRISDAEISYGEQVLLDAANLNINSGEKIALVGRNGAGKSTLLKVLAGQLLLDDGERWVAEHTRVSYLQQDVPPATEKRIYDVVVEGLGEVGTLLSEYTSLTARGDAPDDPNFLSRLAELEGRIDTAQGWVIEPRVKRVLEDLRLPATQTMRECSGGLRRRAMLAQALVSEPDLLLLDEPTNHMDIASIEHLQRVLQNTSACVVFVTHDRALIDAIASRIVEVDRGALIDYPGNYAQFLSGKQKASEEEDLQHKKFDKVLAEEEAWIREGIKARRTRNEGRVRRLKALRRERAKRQHRQGSVKLNIDHSKRSGDLVAELDNVSFGYTTPIISDFSATISRGDRVGIIGANGSGKSTLLQLILGELSPTRGELKQGTNLQIAYFDQQRASLDLQDTVRRNIADGADHVTIAGKQKHVAGYLADFLFPPQHLNVPVSQLSGGEKNRLLMAKLFAQPANLLVLDEPTNDLDVETLELLEELLLDYNGTIILVSHDRAFLDAVVTSTIVFEENGSLQEFVGGYSDWLAARRTNQSGPAAEPGDTSPQTAATPVPKKKRLSYKDQRELDLLPERIEQLEAQVASLQQQVSEPDFYQQDEAHIKTALERLQQTSAEVEAAYERWSMLSD